MNNPYANPVVRDDESPPRFRWFADAVGALVPLLALATAAPAYDQHFDYTSFENSPGKHFQQAQFAVLKYPSINGNYMMTSTDNHRPEMVANGNALAQFYNPFCCATGSDYLKNPRPTAIEEADAINAYTINKSTNNGVRPDWLVLNEISPSLWQQNPGDPSLSAFRTWAIDCITRLTDVYGYKVIILSPYQQLGTTANAPSWQALANKAYIAIEAYLDGNEVWSSGGTYAQRVAYAQSRYQASKDSYLNVGVPAEKLFVIEHVGNTTSGTGWGRGGIAADDWDQVLMIRQDAIYNVDFAGFLTYAWGGNGMGVTQAEQIQHEYYYRTRRVLASQKPQWLSDSAINVNGTVVPLSWSQPLNWLGGVPNAIGAEVNFWRTNTTSRTITLDGTKTAGTLTFTSPFSYTIAPGTGGTLILNNSASPATLISDQGSHTIGVNVHLTNGLNAQINTGTFTVIGLVSGIGSVSKSSAGTLALNGATNFSGDTNVLAGTLRINTPMLPNSSDVYLSSASTLNLNFAGGPDAIGSLFIDGVSQVVGIWGAIGSGAQYTSALITGAGTLQVITGPVVGDYNGDSIVDAADYMVWRMSTGSATILNRDPNNTGLIGQADYNSWRAHFNQTAGSGAALGLSLNAAVPEASTWSIVVAGVLGMLMRRRPSRQFPASLILMLSAAIWVVGTQSASAELGKGHRILIERGLQVQGMATKDDVFHLATYQNANYSAIHWLWESNPSLHGAAPGFPWARWVGDENQMPNAAEQPYLSQLVALQLGDEWHLNDPAVRDRAVNWFNAIRSQWPDTILYMNNYGGQVNDAALSDFIARAQPDMLGFDTYPWRSEWAGPGQAGAPLGGQPTSWYGELRRYRVYAQNFGVPLAIYRQTFHAIQDYDQTVYRDPSPSELNLNTFGALAFGATTFIDFTYNTGATSLFTAPGGDSNPTPAYFQQADINRRARNLGKSLVHLTGLDSPPAGGQPTLDIMFHRGKTGPGAADVTPLPIGFIPDGALPNTFSEWEFGRNDPHMVGFAVTNLGTRNSGLRGDVIISWFKPLDSSRDDPSVADDQVYFMVVNAFAGPDDGMAPADTAADYRQRIVINFENTVTPSLQRLNSDTGEVEIVNLPVINTQGRRRLTIELDGGMGELFKFNTGHSFLGSEVLPGDFNSDGVVDAADYTAWRYGLGTMYSQAHYEVWRANFGQQSGSGSDASANAIVPEPTTLVMLIVAAVGIRLRRQSIALRVPSTR